LLALVQHLMIHEFLHCLLAEQAISGSVLYD